MSGQRRVTGLVLITALACAAVGCGFVTGKKIKYEDIKRIQQNMTLAQVEEVMGSGSEPTADDINRMAQATVNTPPAQGGLDYKVWKDSKTLMIMGFQNGRMVRSFFTTSDPELNEQLRKDREGQRPQQPTASPPDDERLPVTPAADEAQMHHRMSILAGQLMAYARLHQDRLPANIEELEQWGNWQAFPPDVQQGVRTGQYVIAWGARVGRFEIDKVVAWPQDAKEKGGYVGKSSGTAEKLSAEQVKARIAKP